MVDVVRVEAKDSKPLSIIAKAAYTDEIRRFDPDNKGEGSEYPTVDDVLLDIENYMYFKIVLQTEIIGGFYIERIGRSHLQIEDLCIHPNYQNKGYGKQTLRIIEDMFPLVKLWTLETPTYSVRNQHLYKIMGYQEIGISELYGIKVIKYEKYI